MATKKFNITDEQIKELKKLARAQRYAEEAKQIRARFKAFTEDNLDTLVEGVEIDGLMLGVKISKQLTVEEV